MYALGRAYKWKKHISGITGSLEGTALQQIASYAAKVSTRHFSLSSTQPSLLGLPTVSLLRTIPPTQSNSSKGAMFQQQKAQGPYINYPATSSEPLKKLVMQGYHGILSIKIHTVWNRERRQHLHAKGGHVVTFWNSCQQPPYIILIQFLILILSMLP